MALNAISFLVESVDRRTDLHPGELKMKALERSQHYPSIY